MLARLEAQPSWWGPPEGVEADSDLFEHLATIGEVPLVDAPRTASAPPPPLD